MRVQASKAVVRGKEWFRGDARLHEDYLPYLTPTVPFNPATRSLVDAYIGENLKTVPPVLYASEAAVAEPALVPVPAGETWEVLQIVGSVDTDGNAANRVCTIDMTGFIVDPGGLPPIDFIATTGPTITANQIGGSILSEGMSPNLVTNTNGVLAIVADENFLPIVMVAGSLITHDPGATVQAGDAVEVGVHYRRVA